MNCTALLIYPKVTSSQSNDLLKVEIGKAATSKSKGNDYRLDYRL